MFQRHIDHTAALAAAAQPEEDDVVLDVHEVDVAAVGRDSRIDHLIEELLDCLRLRPLQSGRRGRPADRSSVGSVDLEAGSRERLEIVEAPPFKEPGALGVYVDLEPFDVHDDVLGTSAVLDEVEAVLDAAAAASLGGHTQPLPRPAFGFEDLEHLLLCSLRNCQHVLLLARRAPSDQEHAVTTNKVSTEAGRSMLLPPEARAF